MNRPGEATLTGPQAQHVIDVLKAVPGNTVRIGMLNGALGSGTVMAITDRTVSLRCTFDETVHPRPRVDLLLALPRPKVLRRLWAQLAALGVGQIILTNAERVERNYFDTHVLTEACYRPLLIEGRVVHQVGIPFHWAFAGGALFVVGALVIMLAMLRQRHVARAGRGTGGRHRLGHPARLAGHARRPGPGHGARGRGAGRPATARLGRDGGHPGGRGPPGPGRPVAHLGPDPEAVAVLALRC